MSICDGAPQVTSRYTMPRCIRRMRSPPTSRRRCVSEAKASFRCVYCRPTAMHPSDSTSTSLWSVQPSLRRPPSRAIMSVTNMYLRARGPTRMRVLPSMRSTTSSSSCVLSTRSTCGWMVGW
ncbi:PP164 [Orf virus]|uniref:PP164 n=1 Tax=Orf virus TaxID=10258 RepID=F1AWZ1_ORFV|nr:PP164 [Orf virus]